MKLLSDVLTGVLTILLVGLALICVVQVYVAMTVDGDYAKGACFIGLATFNVIVLKTFMDEVE